VAIDFDLIGDAGAAPAEVFPSANGSFSGVVLVGRPSGLGGCTFPANVSVEASRSKPEAPVLACVTSEGAVDTSGIIWIGAIDCSIG
jgi:hypothetical protein